MALNRSAKAACVWRTSDKLASTRFKAVCERRSLASILSAKPDDKGGGGLAATGAGNATGANAGAGLAAKSSRRVSCSRAVVKRLLSLSLIFQLEAGLPCEFGKGARGWG